jgi:ABC-2 type transport system permease protein
MHRIFFPNAMWVALALWVAPAVLALGLGVSVIVSSRAQGFQDAYQMTVIVVVPLLVLLIGQVAGVVYFNLRLVLLLGLALWFFDALLIWIGGRTFRRSEIIARL